MKIIKMKNRLTKDIIRQLPKAELHCHLDGFVRPQTVIELASEQGVTLPTTDLAELSNLMTCPMDCPDLPTYLKCFDIVLKVMQHPYAITRIFYEACEDAVKDGILYIELRFAPALHTEKGLSYSQILQAAIDGCIMAEKRLPITPRIICCGMRQMPNEINQKIAEICWRFRHRFVVGYDLAGPEYGFPPDKHVAAFRTIRRKGLSVTIHAGEAFGAKSVELALACSAQRIGHGTHITEDKKVQQEILDRRITLEMCVSSNLQTKAITKFEDHPIKQFFDMGIRTVPCTDNPTVSGITLTDEYYLIQEKFGFSVADLIKMMDYGFRGSFLPETIKKRLRVTAFVKSMKILQENNFDISGIVENADYYANMGCTVPPSFTPPCQNPPLTLELLQQIPKCDLDCRFTGSVPFDLLYTFYTELSDEHKKKLKLPDFTSAEDLKNRILEKEKEKHKEVKLFSVKLLQTESNIRRGITAILKDAYDDKVVYMEITICPMIHTHFGLTQDQVLDIVIDESKKFCEGKEMMVNFVVSMSIAYFTPLKIQKAAELCVKYHGKGVVGFMTTTQEIRTEDIQYYEEIFEYLRKNYVPVTMFAGENQPNSVLTALINGNARRISGGFQVTQVESLLGDVTSHNTSILVCPSERFQKAVAGWSKSPARFFFDFGVRIAFCTINHAFSQQTRSQQLYTLAETSGFDALNMMRIIDNSLGSAFTPNQVSKKLQKKFWHDSIDILSKHGYKRFINIAYFVPD